MFTDKQSADILLKQSCLKDLHVITSINEGERARVPYLSLIEKAKRCLLLYFSQYFYTERAAIKTAG